MMTRGRILFTLLSLLIVSCIVGGTLFVSTAARADDGKDSLYKYLSVFTDVLGLVKRAYVDETETDDLMAGAFEGAVDALDPFSLYVPVEQVEGFLASREIGQRRSGLTLLKERGVAIVMGVEEGSPADRAGLEFGDVLPYFGGEHTRDVPLVEMLVRLAGEPGTEIEVGRYRLGEEETLRFALEDYAPPPVVLEEKKGVPVLRVPSFHGSTLKDVERSLRSLEPEVGALPGIDHPERLVVDLRGVVGGDEPEAYSIAGLFAHGELGRLESREAEPFQTFTSDREPLWKGERVVVLVNRGTQGAGEILASVLKQSLDAQLVGERTFGHAGRTNLLDISNGGRLQLTDAFYTGPDGEPIDEGLQPDVPVRSTLLSLDDEEAKDADPILDRGIEEVLGEGEEEVPEQVAA